MGRLLFMIEESYNKIYKDNISGYAAQTCFFAVLSLFPCLLVLMTLIRFLPVSQEVIISELTMTLPSQAMPLVESVVNDLYNSSSLTLTSLPIIGVLWATGKGFMSLMQGFNKIYETKYNRNWLVQRLLSTVYTISFIIIIILTLLLIVFGNKIVDITQAYWPQIAIILRPIINNRIILMPCIMILLFAIIYIIIPERKTTFLKELPGSIFSSIGWYVFSYIFSLYVDYSPNFSYMYGSLTTLIFVLMWLYFCFMILFFGAELNALIDKKIIRFFWRK